MSNVTTKSALDEIISDLGKYFGVLSKSAFVNYLSEYTAEESDQSFDTAIKYSHVNLGEVILNMQEGGKFTHDIIRQVSEKMNPKNENNASSEKIISTMRITYEPTTDAKNCIAVHGYTAGAKTKDQGSGGNDIDIFSMKKVLGLPETNEINQTPENPNKYTSPCLSVIQMFPALLTPANRDTGAISLLLNAISTLEISRAVPFIDIVSINNPTLTPEGSDGDGGRIMQMSLGQFLLGNDKVSGFNAKLIGAVDAEVVKEPPPPFDPNEQKNKEAVRTIGTSGMELFTSPQTLVAGDESHYEFDSIENAERNVLTGDTASNTLHPGGKRAAPVIDRFRPLMTLTEFKVNVSPLTGFMSYKSADLTLVLHDRSRLAEIAPFVKPDNFNNTDFLIEYGWAHPENKVHTFQPLGNSLTLDNLKGNLDANHIGLFLSHLRCKEKYKVVNSSFSFDDVGQVQINIKLAMLGADDLNLAKIGQGGKVEDQFRAVERITSAIADINKKMSAFNQGSGSEDVTGDGNILNVASSTESAVNLSEESQKKIRQFLSKNKGKDNVQDIKLLQQYFTDLLGPNGDGKGGAVASLKKSIAEVIQDKIKIIRNGYDPWIRTMEMGSKRITEGNIGKYVSLAKVFSVFLGMPLADTRKFDDIQIYFYAFNDRASFCSNLNIASFPIDIDDLETMLKEELKLEANMPIMKFLNFINKAFILDQGAPAYGMSNIYGERDKEDLTNRKIKKEFEDDATAMFGEKQKVLRSAYGEGEELSFKLPSLKIKIESIPAAKKTIDSDGVNETGSDKSILRLQIFDSQATSYTCLAKLLSAAKKNQLNVLTKSAGNVINRNTTSPDHQSIFNQHITNAIQQQLLSPIPLDEKSVPKALSATDGKRHFQLTGGFTALKNFIMRSMPSARYGSQNSGIIKATVQSMQNPLLATVNMQRQGLRSGEEAQSKRDSGVPMTVQPIECSLQTIGCPLWEFGQHIFIDFGTGTTVDNIYVVIGIDHSIKQGEFISSLKMQQLTAWGVYESMIDTVTKATAILADKMKDDQDSNPSDSKK
jgi:hypothetical protein